MRGTKTDIWVWKQIECQSAALPQLTCWEVMTPSCVDCTGLRPSFVVLLSFLYAFLFFVAFFVRRKAGSP